MPDIGNSAGWWSEAACLTSDPDLFFPISWSGPALRQVAEAKAICAGCPIRQACLGYALEVGPVEGIWGGTTEAERRPLARAQAAGLTFAQQALSP